MILSVSNISKAFEENTVLNNISFHLEENDKAAIIGVNGAGKTTLLRIITNELEPDSGSVVITKDKTVGYLSQESTVNSKNTIYEELLLSKKELVDMENRLRRMEDMMSQKEGNELNSLMDSYEKLSHTFELMGGLTFRSEINGIISGLGFEGGDLSRPIDTLSGGQKTRVALSRILVQSPDLIIMDEPTNHLDLKAIAFLENYLLNYKKAVIIVSHDRYFLDRIVNKVVEIENGACISFSGNYSEYAVKKEALRIEKMNAYYKQQNIIAHQEAVIKKLREFNREKSIKRAESRVKALNKIERLEKPIELNDAMNLTLMPNISSGNDVLKIEHLSKAYGDNVLFKDISFDLRRGEVVALIGDNGTGKTTILKIINGLLDADEGSVTLGTNVEIGYYDQEHHVLHEDKTLFEELQDEHPTMNNTEVRNVLAAFLFTEDDVFKKIKNLSGGEKGRVSLAKLMLSKGNFLILDEPTNHLDITSKEILEDAINAYEGTVLYVSHDRYFINRTADRIIELSDDTVTGYLGDYDYYVLKKGQQVETKGNITSAEGNKASEPPSKGALDYKAQKEAAALKRKAENELKKVEERIEFLENQNKLLNEKMLEPLIATSSVKLQEITNEVNKNTQELDELYIKWEELS